MNLRGLFRRKPKIEIDDIRTATIMTFCATTRPKLYNPKVGQEVEIDMKSGKTAIFEVINVERAWNVDWDWIDLRFKRYLF